MKGIDMYRNQEKSLNKTFQPRRFVAGTGTICRLSTLALSVLVLELFSGCPSPQGFSPEQQAAPTAVTLVSGDVIKLSFPGAPEMSQSQKIRTDGKVNLPVIGEVLVSG